MITQSLYFLIALWLCTIELHSQWPLESQPKIHCGIDVLLQDLQKNEEESIYARFFKKKRIGLITNQTGRTRQGKLTSTALNRFLSLYNSKITALFALEHGVQGLISDREAIISENNSAVSPKIISLYGSSDEALYPPYSAFDDLDLLIYDIADVGTRCYTYASSLYYVLERLKEYEILYPLRKSAITTLVLDRPNPINGVMVDGPCVEQAWESFVGVFALPVCHGMTIGELALMYNNQATSLVVVPIEGWKRDQTVTLSDLTWIPSSPNMPLLETTRLYPITVIGEGLSFLSMGKKTPQAFQFLAAPEIDGERWAIESNKLLQECQLLGVRITDHNVIPLTEPYQDRLCQGIRLEILDSLNYQPIAIQYVLLEALQNTHPQYLVGQLKKLYKERLKATRLHVEKPLSDYHQACWLMGTSHCLDLLSKQEFRAQNAIQNYRLELIQFLEKRQPYLLY